MFRQFIGISLLCSALLGSGAVNATEVQTTPAHETRLQQRAALIKQREAGPARDIETFSEDLRLTNRCIESGKDKATCLCLTQVLKYELPLGDYRAASRLYTHAASIDRDRSVTRFGLAAQGMTDRQISEIDYAVRGLTSAPDFQERCQTAKRYFRSR